MLGALQRLVKQAIVAQQRRGGIDIERRADGGRDLGHRNVLGVQGAVPVEKMIHAARLRKTAPQINCNHTTGRLRRNR